MTVTTVPADLPAKGYKVQPSKPFTCLPVHDSSEFRAIQVHRIRNQKLKVQEPASPPKWMSNSEPNSIMFHPSSLQYHPDFNILQHFMHRTHWYIGTILQPYLMSYVYINKSCLYNMSIYHLLHQLGCRYIHILYIYHIYIPYFIVVHCISYNVLPP